jgi:hypothetical protein
VPTVLTGVPASAEQPRAPRLLEGRFNAVTILARQARAATVTRGLAPLIHARRGTGGWPRIAKLTTAGLWQRIVNQK